MDTLRTKSEAACNDPAHKKTPGQPYIDPPVTSTDDATDNGSAAAETGSRSQSTNGEADGKGGAHGVDEGAQDVVQQDPETQEGAPPRAPTPQHDNEQAPKPDAVKTDRERAEGLDMLGFNTGTRFAREIKGRAIYVPDHGWFTWNRKHWQHDGGEAPTVRELAKDTVAAIAVEGVRQEDEERRKRAAKLAASFAGARGIAELMTHAKSEPVVLTRVEELDPHAHLLSVANGTIDLRTGDLRDHDPRDMITSCAPTPFEPEATHEAFDALLERLFPEREARAYVQRAVGYSLFAKPIEDVIFLLVGPKRGGKSTFRDAIYHALGAGLVARARMETFTQQSKGNASQARSDLHRLRGSRFAMAAEADPGQRFSTGLLKGLAGGEPLISRTLHGKESEAPVTFTIWIVANPEDLPHIRPEDGAVWERVRKVPVGGTIPEAKRDPKFRERMASEPVRRAVLAWAVQGAIDYEEHGLGKQPEIVRKATANLRADMDDLGGFIESQIVFDPEAVTAKQHVRDALAEHLGEQPAPSSKQLAEALRAAAKKAGAAVAPTSARIEGHEKPVRAWKGVRLVE